MATVQATLALKRAYTVHSGNISAAQQQTELPKTFIHYSLVSATAVKTNTKESKNTCRSMQETEAHFRKK